jgi:hypothetical protein
MLYSRGYGMSNLEYSLAITPASIFHVASISKQFTAAAIPRLSMEGRLSRDTHRFPAVHRPRMESVFRKNHSGRSGWQEVLASP